MPDPFTIRIFVPDGDPEGVRLIDRMNWTGLGVVFPRFKWSEVRQRSESAALDRGHVTWLECALVSHATATGPARAGSYGGRESGYQPSEADIVILVMSRPSEDVMAAYDAPWPSANFLWRVMGCDGLQSGETRLVTQFEKGFESMQKHE